MSETQTHQIVLVLPKIVEADDYHDFYATQDALRLVDNRLKCVEIGTIVRPAPQTGYLGVIYMGPKPSKRDLQARINELDLEKAWRGTIELN